MTFRIKTVDGEARVALARHTADNIAKSLGIATTDEMVDEIRTTIMGEQIIMCTDIAAQLRAYAAGYVLDGSDQDTPRKSVQAKIYEIANQIKHMPFTRVEGQTDW
jgi:ketol-acid reductoisomerase